MSIVSYIKKPFEAKNLSAGNHRPSKEIYIVATLLLICILLARFLSDHVVGLYGVIGSFLLIAYMLKKYIKLQSRYSILKEINSDLESANVTHLTSSDQIIDMLGNVGIPAIIKEDGKIIKRNAAAAKLTQEQIEELAASSKQMLQVNDKKKVIALTKREGAAESIIGHLMESDLSHTILNFDTKVLHSNPRCQNLLGFRSQSNVYIKDFLHSDDEKKLDELVRNVKKHGKADGHEFLLLDNKTTLSIHMSLITVKSVDYIFCTLLDLTEYKMLKENMLQSQKMQAVGQLAGSISHDFNNLLTAMIGFCDILLVDKKPTDNSYNEIMQIRQNANRAADLVKQLLAFSRKQVLSLKVINVNNTIVALSNLLERLLGEHIELNIDFGKDLNNVLADRVQLEQVIINLAVNARDAMESKGNLYVRTYNIGIDEEYEDREYYSPAGDDPLQKGDYVALEICDTGTGIPEEVVDNIFEPFFSTKDQLSGTGLGLATVYGIIKQIGGHIRFKTVKNQGTCFYIFLKATIDEEEHIEEDDNKTMSELLVNDSKDKSKILIVEDETPVRLFELHALTSKGYKVIDTGDAESAMNFLDIEGNDIKLVITDVVMPGIKGPEMADKIKEKYPHIKFIFTSGYAEESLSYFDENEHHFLAKPFSLQTLLSKVKEVLEEDD